jgi:anti-sigma factor RsiW
MTMGVTKLKCKHVCDLMPEYHSGELSPAQTANVRLHVSECESCRREMAIVARAMNALRTPVTHVEPPNVLAAVKAQARAQKSQWRAAFANWSLAAVAAGALVIWIAVSSHSTLAPNTVARVQPAPTASIPERMAALPAPEAPDPSPAVLPTPVTRYPAPVHVSRAVRRVRIHRRPAQQIASLRTISHPPTVKVSPKAENASTDAIVPEAEHTPQVASAGHYYRSDDGSVRIEIPLPDKAERVCVATMPSTD